MFNKSYYLLALKIKKNNLGYNLKLIRKYIICFKVRCLLGGVEALLY